MSDDIVVTPAGTETPADTTPDYVRVLFTDETLPAAKGEIAKALTIDSLTIQRKNAEVLYTFLKDEADHLRLNIGKTPLTAMMLLPDTSTIKII